MSTTDLSENRGPELRATTIAIVVLACVFVGLRLTARRTTGMGLGMDDYTLLVALFFLFVAAALALLGIHFGLGRHAGALTVPILVHWGKTLMAFECVYVTCVATIKVSLVMMYCRIFPIRNIRIGAYILGSLSIAWAISIIMVSIFQCTPIQKAWNSSLPGHCINLKKSFIGNAVPNFMTDIAILMLPMRQVWTLQTSMIQRAELSFVFLLGSFVVFTSIYRFSTLFQFEATDPSFTLATAWIWCVVESASGIISACLPTLGPFVKSAHRALGLSSAKSRSQPTRSNTALKTIGGSGGASRNLSNLESGIYDGSRSKGGSRPFKRLDEDGLSLEENSPPASKSGSKMTSNVGVHSIAGDGHSTDGDEIPLQGIRVRTDVEWSEEGKKIAARDNAARKI